MSNKKVYFNFICVDVLPAYLPVCFTYMCDLERLENDIISFETGVTDSCEFPHACHKSNESMCFGRVVGDINQ